MPKYYEEERKRQAKDGAMLSEDHGAVANMPQQVKYHSWPTSEKYLGEASPELNDTISGVNAQMGDDVRGAKKHRSHNKY